jgi:hypothetical protein
MITAEHPIGQGEATPQMSERVFGLFLGCVLTVLSLAPLVFGNPHKPRLLIFALSLGALALICPILLRWPKRIWLFITHKISLVVNFLLMTVMFFAVVTPVAVFFRISGRDPLKRKLDTRSPSYWVKREAGSGSMGNQF